MKLRKLLVAGALALSSLTMAATPVMANTGWSHAYEYHDNLEGTNIKVQSVECLNTVAYNHNGGHSVNHYRVRFLVKNCTYDKHIVLHYQPGIKSENWIDSEPAHYVGTLYDGSEIWELDAYAEYDSQFCAWYQEVDSWDNNNGANYQF